MTGSVINESPNRTRKFYPEPACFPEFLTRESSHSCQSCGSHGFGGIRRRLASFLSAGRPRPGILAALGLLGSPLREKLEEPRMTSTKERQAKPRSLRAFSLRRNSPRRDGMPGAGTPALVLAAVIVVAAMALVLFGCAPLDLAPTASAHPHSYLALP